MINNTKMLLQTLLVTVLLIGTVVHGADTNNNNNNNNSRVRGETHKDNNEDMGGESAVQRKLRAGNKGSSSIIRQRFPATIVSHSPAAGAVLTGSTTLTAQIQFPRNRAVEFLLTPPSGTGNGQENWMVATKGQRTNNIGTWTLDYTFTESGQYSYQIRTVGSDGNVGIVSDVVTFTVTTDGGEGEDGDGGSNGEAGPDDVTMDIIEAAKSSIESLIEDEPQLSPKFVRLGFHDCVGGCDGCVDLEEPDNNGLEVPIAALDSVVDEFIGSGMSRADIWALAALVGAEVAQPNNQAAINFPMMWVGRVDCENTGNDCLDGNNNPVPCSAVRGPHRVLPPMDLNTTGVTHFFSQTFGFTPRETVALMGAHTIGTLSIANSGIPGNRGWANNALRLDNNYYSQIVGAGTTIEDLVDAPNWNLREQENTNGLPDRFFWVRGGGGGGNNNNNDPLVMLNADIALVRDITDFLEPDGRVTCRFLEGRGGGGGGGGGGNNNNNPGCPFAAMTIRFMGEYRNNNALWVNDFRAVFTKMLTHGYDTSAGCIGTSAPCVLP